MPRAEVVSACMVIGISDGDALTAGCDAQSDMPISRSVWPRLTVRRKARIC